MHDSERTIRSYKRRSGVNVYNLYTDCKLKFNQQLTKTTKYTFRNSIVVQSCLYRIDIV